MSDPWIERLSPWIDGELEADEARALERHVEECAACGAALAQLRELRQRARELPDRAPERDLWPALAARLEPAVRRRGRLAFPLAAAALVALSFGLGRWSGGRPAAPAGDGGGRYLLILHESPELDAGASPEEMQAVVAEYSSWARGLGAELVSGEKLAPERWVLRPGEGTAGDDVPDDVIGGFFLIRARGPERAREIARDCPHLEHGGWIELRPIEEL